MSNVIIYKQDGGTIAVVYPCQDSIEEYGIHWVARKDVPAGKRYKIISSSDLPNDRALRDAWTVDDSYLTDGIGEGSE